MGYKSRWMLTCRTKPMSNSVWVDTLTGAGVFQLQPPYTNLNNFKFLIADAPCGGPRPLKSQR